jgi:outer membrane protein TolC
MRSSDKSPLSQEIPAWCRQYQLRLEAAAQQVRLIRQSGDREEAKQAVGEVEMWDQDQVQSKLQELTQQMVHVVQSCNEEKGLMEDEYLAV